MAVASKALVPHSGPVLAAAAAAAQDFIFREGLAGRRDHIVVAFSGGADSTALVLILRQLGYHITLAHIDHAMRPGSVHDAVHCASIAGKLGLDFRIAAVVVEPPTQAVARDRRYGALEDIARSVGAARIATGHTAGDQAETVRLRLDRGGFGLGMPPRRGKVVRPLLELWRDDTEAVCREAAVAFIDDPTNHDMRFARNRVRRELAALPPHELARYLALAGSNRRSVEQAGRRAAQLAGEMLVCREGRIEIDRAALLRLSEADARATVRSALQKAGIEPRERYVMGLMRRIARVTGSSADLSAGVAAWSEPALLVIGPRPLGAVFPQVPLALPGTTMAPGWRRRIKIHQVDVPPVFRTAPNHAFFDEEILTGPLALRSRQPGDRFWPLGLGRSKKLQDFFVDLKVARHRRDGVPLLVSGGKVAWVVGYRIDERFKIGPATRSAVKIEVTLIEQ